MNLVEIWVTNIQSVERVPNLDFCLYEKHGTTIQVNGYDY